MPRKDLTIAMVGAGGDGVVTMGEMLAQAAAREGLNVIKTEAYGPQIRGGESSCTVRFSSNPIYAQGDSVDVLIVLSWADFGRFKSEIVPADDAVILFEQTDAVPEAMQKPGFRFIPAPLIETAKTAAGTVAAKNIVTLALISEMFGFPKDAIRSAIEKKFSKKKAAVLESNIKGFEAGVELAATFGADVSDKKLTYERSTPKLLMSGNEASAIGAVHAGCRFFAGYPITPSSEILHLLGEWLPRFGGSVLQTEDELAAFGAVVGGSFAGVKSMTATSGPGLSLMQEMLGLSSIAEIPSVIVNVQRGGPSTGIPTKSEQSDLWSALFGGHGDAPRVILAPTDVEDCFHATVDAFNISEEFQMPVIVLSDQLIGQRRETLAAENLKHEVVDRRLPNEEELADYHRYQDTPTGVSPMSYPGLKGGMYQTNGLEHDERGGPNSMFLMHERMNEKRYRKLYPIRDKYRLVRRYGPAKADVGIITWGSSKGAVQEAVTRASARGERVAAFVPQMIYPFPKKELEEFMASVGELMIVEINYSAQFYKYLRTFVDLPEDRLHIFKRSGGKYLTVEEVEQEIRRVMRSSNKNEEVLV